MGTTAYHSSDFVEIYLLKFNCFIEKYITAFRPMYQNFIKNGNDCAIYQIALKVDN